MAVWTGLEPATPCVTGRYSNQLNYHTVFLLLLSRSGNLRIIQSAESASLNHCSDSECKGNHIFQISKLFTEIFSIFLSVGSLTLLVTPSLESMRVRLSHYGSLHFVTYSSSSMEGVSFNHWSNQRKNSRWKRMPFCGFAIQWFSSGKISIRDGMPRSCAALNAIMPCDARMR